ncbi:MAG: hypothetical protein FD181_2746 [Prolixibacteraceae bacterium]|nr:MAG: hypothetical protein FD181_2746 [Prolixibacteraceae bacterium]
MKDCFKILLKKDLTDMITSTTFLQILGKK